MNVESKHRMNVDAARERSARPWRRMRVALAAGAAFALLAGGCQPRGAGTGNAATAAPTWAKSYGGPGNDYGSMAIRTAEGGYLFVGSRDGGPALAVGRLGAFGSDSWSDLWITKLDALGDVQWERAYGENSLGTSGAGVRRRIVEVQFADDGGYWLVGNEYEGNRADTFVVRLDAAGSAQWTRTYDVPSFPGLGQDRELRPAVDGSIVETLGDVTERVERIATTRDGGLLIASSIFGQVLLLTGTAGQSASGTSVMKLAPNGDLQWQRHLVLGPLGDLSTPVTNVREAADGTVLVTTLRELVRMDAGAVRWISDEGRSDGNRVDESGAALLPLEYAGRTGPAAMEGVLVAGSVDSGEWDIVDRPGISAPMIRRYAYDGAQQWERALNVGETGRMLAVQPGCTQFATRGTSCNAVALIDPNRQGEARRNELLAQALDPDGAELRVATSLAGLRGVCDFRREDAFLPDGRPALRALVSDADRRLGTVVLDDLGAIRQPFTPLGATHVCGEFAAGTVAPRLAPDGRVARLEYSFGDGDARQFVVTDANGSELVRRTFRETAGPASYGLHQARAVIQTDDDADGRADDGYLVALDVYQGLNATGAVAMLAKLDASGRIEWLREYPELRFGGTFLDVSRRLAQTFEGSGAARRPTGYAFVASARSTGSFVPELVLVRTGASGSVVASSVVLADDAVDAERAALVATPDGGIVAVADDDVVRIGADGAVQWRRDLSIDEQASAVVALADGYAVGGGSADGPLVVRLAPDGAVRWARRYPLVASGALRSIGPVALDAAPDGTLLVGSTIATELPESAQTALDDDHRYDLRVLALAPDGAVRWDRQLGGRESDVLTSLEATPDGGALVGATSASLGEAAEAWILRLGPDGRVAAGCAAEFATAVGLGRAQTIGIQAAPAAAPARTALVVGDRVAALSTRQSAASTVVARQCAGVAQAPTSPTDPPPPNTSELTVVQGGSITGVVYSVPNGILCGVAQNAGACTARFPNGMRVSLDIDPGSRPRFEGWSGCDAVFDSRCELTIDRARSVTVRFSATPQADLVTFAIDAIGGRGRVTGTGGLNCVAGRLGVPACRVSVGRNSQLSVTATPDDGRTFLGWGGACASSGTTRSILYAATANAGCTANFSGPPAGVPNVAVTPFPFLPPDGAVGYSYVGTVTSTPPGIDCGARGVACVEGFAAGTNVRLTAEATLAGWEFDRFDCTGLPEGETARSVDLGTLVSDVNCNALFSRTVRRLVLRMLTDDAPRSPGRVRAIDGGLDCTADCDRSIAQDRVVVLRATPDADHRFDSWEGCESQSVDPLGPGRPPLCSVRLDQSREVIAFFSRSINSGFNVVLAIGYAPGSTAGRTTSQPGPIDCTPQGGTCSATFRVNDEVVLSIAPPPGGSVASQVGCDTFVAASGASAATCGVAMSRDRVVTFGTTRANAPPVASFTFEPQAPLDAQPVTFDARASSDDVNIVAYRWDYTNNGSFDAVGALVTEAFPAGSYTTRLRVEDGDGAFAETTRSFTVAAADTRYPLTVTRDGSGAGTVIALQQGINCGSDCTEEYPAGSLVDLVANPSGGSSFGGWQACPQQLPQPSGIPVCRVTMTGPLTIGASFAAVGTQVALTLRMQGSGDGVVTYSPSTTACSKSSEPTCVRSFAVGTTVTLNALAYSGFRVGEWGGCDTVTQNGTRCTVTMNAARTVDVFLVP